MGKKYGKINSWNIINDNQIIKKTDKSVFEHHSSGIPAKSRWFWGAEQLENRERMDVMLYLDGREYRAYIRKEVKNSAKLIWYSDLKSALLSRINYTDNIKKEEYPLMIFMKLSEQGYEIALENDCENKQLLFDNSPETLIEQLIDEKCKNTLLSVLKKTIKSQRKKRSNTKHIDKIDYTIRSDRQGKIGLVGEFMVIEFEKSRGKEIEHISLKDDSAGYDIKSQDKNGNEIFIEVKTTTGNANQPFFISRNEVNFLKENSDKYFLYRISSLDVKNKTGDLEIIQGDISESMELVPETYKVIRRE